MKLNILIGFIILVSCIFCATELTTEDLTERAVLYRTLIDPAVINMGKNEHSIIHYFSPKDQVYEVNITPEKTKRSSKHTSTTEEMCYVQQQYMFFSEHPKTWVDAFPEYFVANGEPVDLSKPIPRLVQYVRTQDGMIALDSFYNMIFFKIKWEDQYPYLAKDKTVPYRKAQDEDTHGIDRDVTASHPHILYASIWEGEVHKEAIYLVFEDDAYRYDESVGEGSNKFVQMNQWQNVEKVHRARIGYHYGFKMGSNQEYRKKKPTMFVAGGTTGLLQYRINETTLELDYVKTFDKAAFGSGNDIGFSIEDVDHFQHEESFFALDQYTGIRRINVDADRNSVMDPKNVFFLEVQHGRRLSHYPRVKDHKIVQQSFLVISEHDQIQKIIEFDYNMVTQEWFQKPSIKYSYFYGYHDLIMSDDFALILSTHYQQVYRHSIYDVYTDKEDHKMSLEEKYDQEMHNTAIVPGLIDAEFWWKDYHNTSVHRLEGNHQYMMGITLHHVILYTVKDQGAFIACNLQDKNVKSGTYVYNISSYQNICTGTKIEDNHNTYDDFITCNYQQLIEVKVQGEYDDDDLAWWAILLIVIFVIGILACAGFGGFKIYQARKLEQNNQASLTQQEKQVSEIENKNKQQKYEIFKEDDDEQ